MQFFLLKIPKYFGAIIADPPQALNTLEKQHLVMWFGGTSRLTPVWLENRTAVWSKQHSQVVKLHISTYSCSFLSLLYIVSSFAYGVTSFVLIFSVINLWKLNLEKRGGGTGRGSANVCSRFDNGIMSGRVWIVPTHSGTHIQSNAHRQKHTQALHKLSQGII